MRPELTAAIDVVREAGRRLVPYFGNTGVNRNKSESPASVVTKLDIDTEKFIEERLKDHFPDIGFHGEEGGDKRGETRFWLVDPIDGTGHFVRGIPFSTTMLALIEDGKPVTSIIYKFMSDEMYTAEKGKGAFCNGNPIHVSSRALKDSYLAIEAKVTEKEDLDAFIALRRVGSYIHTVSSGFEFTLIASGMIEGKVTVRGFGSDWDYAPGSLLVTEAGGVVTNIGSSSYDYTIHRFIAANREVHRELTEGEHAIFPIRV